MDLIPSDDALSRAILSLRKQCFLWIDVIHDLLRKRGNVCTAPVVHSFFLSLPQKESKRSSAGKI